MWGVYVVSLVIHQDVLLVLGCTFDIVTQGTVFAKALTIRFI